MDVVNEDNFGQRCKWQSRFKIRLPYRNSSEQWPCPLEFLLRFFFHLLLHFKQQNALRGLVTGRCSVLALRSKQVKFLHCPFLPCAFFGRRLAPQLWARIILAGLGCVLVPQSEAGRPACCASPHQLTQAHPCPWGRGCCQMCRFKLHGDFAPLFGNSFLHCL